MNKLYLQQFLRYQQNKIWSESNDSCHLGHHLVSCAIYGTDTTEHAQEWSFVVHEEDEMIKKCLILALQYPIQTAFFPGPEWGAVVLDRRCFSDGTSIAAQHKYEPAMKAVRVNGQITEVKQPRPIYFVFSVAKILVKLGKFVKFY